MQDSNQYGVRQYGELESVYAENLVRFYSFYVFVSRNAMRDNATNLSLINSNRLI